MTGILSFEDVELGYCDQCGRPCVPGVFKITGWHHRFRICDVCLNRTATDLTVGVNKLMETFKK